MEIQIQEPTTATNALVKKVDQQRVALFNSAEAGELRRRWEEIQIGFVDEPKGAVGDADKLVSTVIERLSRTFAEERTKLEAEWGKGESVSTEDLRMALRRYRSLFDRLLSV